jgi:amino acid permease
MENQNDLQEKIVEEDENSITKNQKKDLRLSVFTAERENTLQSIRSMSWFARNFRRLEKGSLRGVIVMWIRMTLGVGVLTLPFYFSVFGYLYGLIAVTISGLLNLNSFYNIFQVSAEYNEKNYLILIEKSLGQTMLKIFKVTFFIDMSSSFIITVIVCWNLFEFSLYFLNLTNDDWFMPGEKDKMKFDEDNPTLFKIRGIFLLVLFLISVPFLLKKTLRSIKKITMAILVLLLALLAFIVFQTPFFYFAKQDSIRIAYKPASPIWIECFFAILMSFYVQPFIFSLREELTMPSLKRMNKVANLTISFEIVLFCIVGFAGYMSLGEKYITDLFLTRKEYDGESPIIENIYRTLIGLFFLLSCLGVAIYNPTMRDYLKQTLLLGETKSTYAVVSILPFFVYCFIAFVWPNIIDVFNWTGLTICNFNGYIVPSLMRIHILGKNKAKKGKMIAEIIQVIALTILCIIGVVFKALKIK